ncbi:MAG: thiosulfate sulfurtransferase [Chromatiales bacterium]|jgi:rhodanese-related sulfurtransferase|nr:thiosulfate sulfurtransferase [Chromatiales bacterium]
MAAKIDAETLRARIIDGGELALVDVREEAPFSRAHLLWASCVPLSRLELDFAQRVPRLDVTIVLCDGDGDLAERAGERLVAFGYSDVTILDGGIAAWSAAGFELFSGVNVPSKAFGEFVEHAYETPSIGADELQAALEAGDDLVVLDSRPIPEYRQMSIPTGVCTPGAELVYRVADTVPSPDTTVVVNCAGRTRSIIGAQSLINAGIPNRVVALRNGTMGWHLAGLKVEQGAQGDMPGVSEQGVEVAKARAANVAKRFGVRTLARDELDDFQRDRSRSLYVLDVRSPEEFEAGHLSGSRNAPGGQLVQATDQYVGVRGARIVLIDDTGVRATMTASWLVQMGWNVWVLENGLKDQALEVGPAHRTVLGLDSVEVEMLSPPSFARILEQDSVAVVDLSSSRAFRRGHISGAKHAVRSRLEKFIATVPPTKWLVFTSEDGVLARFAAREASHWTEASAAALMGGNRAWRDAGYEMMSGSTGIESDPDDVWLRPYDDTENVEQAMRDYLNWEVDLVAQIDRDGTAQFAKWD